MLSLRLILKASTENNNACKPYEELSQLKENRIKEKSRKSENEEPDGQPKKQPKLSFCAIPKYSRDDKHQIDQKNTLSSMICVDAAHYFHKIFKSKYKQ